VALVLIGCLAVAAPTAVAKKKGGKKKRASGGTVDITKVVNLPIPDAIPGPPGSFQTTPGTLTSTIDAGREFRGRRIRDVNLTIQTLGIAGMDPGEDVAAFLTAPNGSTQQLFEDLEGFTGAQSVSIGPLTLDDEALFDLGSDAPRNPTELYVPWAGSAAPDGALFAMDNGPVAGTWVLTVQDEGGFGDRSNLVSWRLNVLTGRPFKTK
jgi:hypothetical protein